MAKTVSTDKGEIRGKNKTNGRSILSISRPHARVLKALAVASKPLSIEEIAKKACVAKIMVIRGLGSVTKPTPGTAVGEKHVRVPSEPEEGERGHRYEITSLGRKALTKYLAEIGGKLPKVAPAPYSKNPKQ